MAFKLIKAEKDSTLIQAFEGQGIEHGKTDIFLYEVQKKEEVSNTKHVALLKGDELSDNEDARKKLGLPPPGEGNGHVAPADIPDGYRSFVQSTSHNRKVHAGEALMVIHTGDATKGGTKRPAREHIDAKDSKQAKKETGGGNAGDEKVAFGKFKGKMTFNELLFGEDDVCYIDSVLAKPPAHSESFMKFLHSMGIGVTPDGDGKFRMHGHEQPYETKFKEWKAAHKAA
mmetsp:Transcript_6756/g.12479  ORF Transcript_6756/g.12479 Transcript_6756/m.12479 type:complete len:229 (-) Transcript_6756:270-956(-)